MKSGKLADCHVFALFIFRIYDFLIVLDMYSSS
jgi:hypothetical protein